jgi:hypothetical protein
MRADFLGVPMDLIDLREIIRGAIEGMRLRCRLPHVALNDAWPRCVRSPLWFLNGVCTLRPYGGRRG